MRLSIYTSLLLAVLISLACKRDRDRTPPEDRLVSDPTNLPHPSATCRIVKETFKMAMKDGDNWPDAETITLDGGQKIKVGRVHTFTYRYDSQGRISEIRTESSGVNEVLSFGYTATTVSQHLVSKRTDGTVLTDETTVAPINSKSHVTAMPKRAGEAQDVFYEYNARGQRTKTYYGSVSLPTGRLYEHNLYEAGNQTQQIWLSTYATGDSLIRSYIYNTSRPNLPSINTTNGNSSQNLPMSVLLSSKGNGFGDGLLFETHYHYLFDQKGLVRRQITTGLVRNPQYLIEEVRGGVNVRGFEYECP
ncbi:hypothetical protein [Tellurirhabdus bombi]|uniref:hypothetical protein n=1 Tax=Tellurirhabdus bombi TaxID=2907205 RepID=UPI001F25E054|nr:hypothetical protein [Tellurirhabdus bombi]